MTDQFLDQIRYFFEIGIRPVGFEHGEFGIVLSRDSLVAEVATDLEHFVEPAYEQPFQIKLRSDAQIQIQAERLVMRDEWFGRGATSEGLQHRRLDLEKTALLEEAPGFANDGDRFSNTTRERSFVRRSR